MSVFNEKTDELLTEVGRKWQGTGNNCVDDAVQE